MAANPEADVGYLHSFPSRRSFEGILKKYEEDTLTKFIVSTKDKAFGQEDPTPGSKKIMWELKYVPFDGVPFMVVGRKVYSCHQGKDKHKKEKQTRQQQLLEDHLEHSYEERGRLLQDSKKLDCPARIYVLHLIRFPGYKIPDDLNKWRRESARRLRVVLATNPSDVKFEEQYAAYFPGIKAHKNHPGVGEVTEVREPVDPRIERRIEKLALAGARKVSEVRRHISIFVSELFRGEAPPHQQGAGFTPLTKTLET
ncbi:calcium-responsive transcription factor-like [Lampris incognitus]|uniref:calcium-responsive transcription factor-like n=1 Tax=Lampris incognitus TaxID=2546036 RepID=UPI0024B5A475|nr:calcium-responsive transcription factor-like [Lampris incognitus]